MRLINLQTLDLEDHNDENAPPYAILSHTWEKEEVTLRDWQMRDQTGHLQGFKKIDGFAAVVRSIDPIDYGWVDTCCIDKSSSAELTEAINSMYKYYQGSTVCVVYLADVFINPEQTDHKDALKRVCRSRWLTRGWTLQELIAPCRVEFFDSAWNPLGSLADEMLNCLAEKTGIPQSVLSKSSDISSWSIATRMSWAASRQTTRAEDEAYCLLGIFDVNMPLIYGEGRKAFVRLQEEIIRCSTDHSIFSWRNNAMQRPLGSASAGLSLLASAASEFKPGNSLVSQCYQDVRGWVQSYEMNNLGLSLSVPLVPCNSQLGVYHAVLNCCFDNMEKGPIALNLKRTAQASASTETNFDARSTVFGVIPIDLLPESKFTCSATHLGRLSIVAEEDLVAVAKTRITILRSYRPNAKWFVGPSPAKARGLSLHASHSSVRAVSSRVKVVVKMDMEPPLEQASVTPTSDWDPLANIWFAKGEVGVMTFSRNDTTLTLALAKGPRECPVRVAILENQSDLTALQWHQEIVKSQDSWFLDLHAFPVRYNLGFADAVITLDRVEGVGKWFHLLTLIFGLNKQQAVMTEAPERPPPARAHREHLSPDKPAFVKVFAGRPEADSAGLTTSLADADAEEWTTGQHFRTVAELKEEQFGGPAQHFPVVIRRKFSFEN